MDKKTYKDLADAVGMPDEVDKQNIRKIILKYDKEHPGYIMHAKNSAREELADTKFGTTTDSRSKSGLSVGGAGSNMRLHLEIPEELYHNIEAYIPTIFREKKHYHWFLKNFPELLIPDKF